MDILGKSLKCFMFKNDCFIKVDWNESATIEIHSPDEVPVFDSTVIQFKPSYELTITYKITETLYISYSLNFFAIHIKFI